MPNLQLHMISEANASQPLVSSTSLAADKSSPENAPHPFLNQAQIACITHYSSGDYSYLLHIDSQDSFDLALNSCFDSLFKFLMSELSARNDCNDIGTATSRLETAIAEILAVKCSTLGLRACDWIVTFLTGINEAPTAPAEPPCPWLRKGNDLNDFTIHSIQSNS